MCGTDPSSGAAFVGFVLTVGTLVSYLVQIVPIFRARSSEGINMLTLNLQLATSGLTLSIVAEHTFVMFKCILEDALPGWAGSLPLLQNITSFTCVLSLIIVVYTFGARSIVDNYGRRFFIAQSAVATANAGTWLVVAPAMAVAGMSGAGNLETLKTSFGVLAAIITCFVWVPQLLMTMNSREKTMLSTYMLVIQSGGGVMMVIYLALLADPHFAWYVWLPYLIASGLQVGILMCMTKYADWPNPDPQFTPPQELPRVVNVPSVVGRTLSDEEFQSSNYIETDDAL